METNAVSAKYRHHVHIQRNSREPHECRSSAHEGKLREEIEFIWEPTRNLYDISVGKDIVKIAIVSGRKMYANEWGYDKKDKPVLVDIDPAYNNIDAFT